jgi:hypothetical protein
LQFAGAAHCRFGWGVLSLVTSFYGNCRTKFQTKAFASIYLMNLCDKIICRKASQPNTQDLMPAAVVLLVLIAISAILCRSHENFIQVMLSSMNTIADIKTLYARLGERDYEAVMSYLADDCLDRG